MVRYVDGQRVLIKKKVPYRGSLVNAYVQPYLGCIVTFKRYNIHVT